jgi:hypothetical protein
VSQLKTAGSKDPAVFLLREQRCLGNDPPMTFRFAILILAAALSLSGCGDSKSLTDSKTAAIPAAFNYAPATIDRLMEACLSAGDSVTACTCLLDSYQGELDDARVLSDAAARNRVIAASVSRCGVTAPLTVDVSTAPQATPAGVEPVRPTVPTPPASTTTVRAQPTVSAATATTRAVSADSPDACLQNKLAAAEKAGSVPIEAFEQFQRECGF